MAAGWGMVDMVLASRKERSLKYSTEMRTNEDPGISLAALSAELRQLATSDHVDYAQFAQLALRTDEMAALAKNSSRTFFTRVTDAPSSDFKSLDRALSHFSSLAEDEFFCGVLLLLLAEANRQLACATNERSSKRIEEILKTLAAYRFTEAFDFDKFLVRDLVAWVLCAISAMLPKLDATPLLAGTRMAQYFLEQCQVVLQKKVGFRAQGVLWDVLERWLQNSARLYRADDALVTLAVLLIEVGDLERAASLIERLPNAYDRTRAGAILASVLFTRGRDAEAMVWVQRDTEYPHILADVLAAEAKRRIDSQKDLEGASKILGAMERPDHRAACRAELTVVWLAKKNFRLAVECLDAAVAHAEEYASPAPLLDSLEAIAEGKLDIADHMADFDQLLERIWVLAENVGVLQGRGSVRVALTRIWAVFGNQEKARRYAERLEDIDRVESLAAIARETQSQRAEDLASQSILDRALKMARQLTYGWKRSPALLAVAHASASIGAAKTAEIFYESFAAAREAMAKPEDYQTAQMLKKMLVVLAATPKFQGRLQVCIQALEVIAELTQDWWKSRVLIDAPVILETLKESSDARDWIESYYQTTETITTLAYRADALEEIAKNLVWRGWLDEVGPCLERINEKERATAQIHLAEELVNEGHHERAVPLLDVAAAIARETARRERTCLEDDVAGAVARCGRLEHALDFAGGIQDQRQRFLALSRVAFEALQLEDRTAACEALLRAINQAPTPRTEITLAFEPTALAILARELAAHDRSGRLRQQLFGAALERTKKLADPERWDDAFLSWARLVTAGASFEGRGALLDTAASEIHQLSSEWRREHLLGELAETLVGAGERKRALRLAETLSSKFRYATLLAAVAREEAQEGRDRPAHDLLSRALEVIAASEPPARGRPLQSGLLPAICALSDEKLRADLIERAISSLYRIELDIRRAETLVDFGKTLAESTDGVWIAKYLSELILAIERAEMPVLALDLEERRIAILARSGDVDEALASARRIDPRNWQHPNALVRIVQELVARQLIGPAFKVFDLIHPESSCVEALRVIVASLKSATSAGAIDAPAFFLERLTGIGDVEARSELLAAWVEGLAQTGLSAELEVAISHRLAELERQMYQAETQDARATTLANVVKSIALLGHLDRALEVLEEANAGEMAAPALAVLAEIAAQHVEVSEKQRIFGAIRNLVQTFEDESILIAGLAKLAHAMARGGFTEQAAVGLSAAVDVCEKLRPVRSRPFVELARPLEAGLAADNPHLVARLLSLTAEIDSEVEQVEALVALARAVPCLKGLRDIDTERISGRAGIQFLTAWRQALLSCDQVPLSVLRATLTWFPEEPGAGFGGVSCLAAALLQRGETAAYDALARSCPAVGLPLLE